MEWNCPAGTRRYRVSTEVEGTRYVKYVCAGSEAEAAAEGCGPWYTWVQIEGRWHPFPEGEDGPIMAAWCLVEAADLEG